MKSAGVVLPVLLMLAPLAAFAAETGAPHIPDTVVSDQDGQRIPFYAGLVKGRTVAINFIFTTCRTICPPLAANFRKVQQELGESSDVRLISISVDPVTDTPERLKNFARKFNAGPGWSLVTGDKADIDTLLGALGAAVRDKNEHTPLLLIGNEAAGYWRRADGLSAASTIVAQIRQAAAQKPEAPASGNDSAATAAQAAKYFPNVELLTQDGATVHFYDDVLRGRTVLINFMFTTCTGVCSPMTANLAAVQKYLGDRLGRDIVMISITVDPLVDTARVLKEYASKFGAKPGWYFLTGKKENVDQVLYKLGGYVDDKNQHSSLLIMGNVARGGWRKVMSTANPATLAQAALELAK